MGCIFFFFFASLNEFTRTGARAARVVVKDQASDAEGQLVSFWPCGSLGVDTDNVLGAGRAHERAAVAELEDNGIDSVLETGRLGQLALSINGLEDGAILDNNLDQAVGEVGVGLVPDLGGPLALGEDGLDQEEIGEGIADSLVNDLGEGAEGADGNSLSGGRALGGVDGLESRRAEEDSAVSVGLKVDTDVVLQSLVVQVLDSSGDARNGDVLLREREGEGEEEVGVSLC